MTATNDPRNLFNVDGRRATPLFLLLTCLKVVWGMRQTFLSGALLTCLFCVQTAVSAGHEFDLNSPSGNVTAHIFQSEQGDLLYRVKFNDNTVVERGVIGISIDGINLGEGVTIQPPTTATINQTHTTRGKHSTARNHFRSWVFPVHHESSKRDYSVEFRVYDDGVAFRYLVPGKNVQHVDGESTSWQIVSGSKVWYFERLAKNWKLKSYAGQWLQTVVEDLHVASPKKVGPVQGTPLVFELPNGAGYAAISKAALYNYSGMRLRAIGDRTVTADFTEGDAGFDVVGDITTPWRVTLLADDLNNLTNSDLISNLNPSPDEKIFSDTSYIRPGRSVWSWETLGLDSVETQRQFIDWAAELEFEYSIVDDGWKEWPDAWQKIESLCTHGRKKNIGVWVWVHSQDIDNEAENYKVMRDYFAQVAQVGAVGLKIDFMNGETKRLVDFEIAALRIAADNKLMINFHGCHASTGESRTWPNEMTREGIRGIEVNKMREGPLTASHNAALPFTRFAVGHADYTPILYTNPGPTSLAHQLATAVLFDSPVQVYAEHPRTMLHSPIVSPASEMMKSIPTTWDETVVLPGSKIGDLAALARRSGKTWFVGIINGGNERSYDLSFEFLGDGVHRGEIVQDDLKDSRARVADIGVNTKADLKQWTTVVRMQTARVKGILASDRRTISLAGGGGAVIRLEK